MAKRLCRDCVPDQTPGPEKGNLFSIKSERYAFLPAESFKQDFSAAQSDWWHANSSKPTTPAHFRSPLPVNTQASFTGLSRLTPIELDLFGSAPSPVTMSQLACRRMEQGLNELMREVSLAKSLVETLCSPLGTILDRSRPTSYQLNRNASDSDVGLLLASTLETLGELSRTAIDSRFRLAHCVREQLVRSVPDLLSGERAALMCSHPDSLFDANTVTSIIQTLHSRRHASQGRLSQVAQPRRDNRPYARPRGHSRRSKQQRPSRSVSSAQPVSAPKQGLNKQAKPFFR